MNDRIRMLVSFTSAHGDTVDRIWTRIDRQVWEQAYVRLRQDVRQRLRQASEVEDILGAWMEGWQ